LPLRNESLLSLGSTFGEHRNEFRRNGGEKYSTCTGDQSRASKTQTAALFNIIGTYTHRHLVEENWLQSADSIQFSE